MTRVALAADIGGSKLMVGLVREDGTVLARRRSGWDSLDKDAVVGVIVDACRGIIAESGIRPDIAGANIPGLVDMEKRLWLEACYSGISDVPMADILEEALGLPVWIGNDINNCAIAEKMYGCCRDTRDFAWLTLSNGCGGALYLNNELYLGGFGFAGEFGHITVVDEGGKRCGCGNDGCLEAHASGRAVAEYYRERTGLDVPITAQDVAERARRGDADAIETFRMEGVYVGKACAAIINIINPEKVVIGGGMSASFDLFEQSLRDTVNRYVYRRANSAVKIERTGLTDTALIGAAACAFSGSALKKEEA